MPNTLEQQVNTTYATGQTPTAGGGDLTAQAAASNIASAPSIDSLTQLLSGINQRAYLSAPGRSQELGTIENQLAGNLDPSTIYANQLRNAEQYGAGGFSGDSQAWQTAIQRGLGLDREALIGQGQKALENMYSGMPQVNAQSFTTSPALLEQQQATLADQALKQQQITNQAGQFTAEQAQQLGEFNTTSAQNAAKMYAGTYGNIPGYNQYGQYTGQTDSTFPSAFLTGNGTGGGSGGGAAGGQVTPQSALANFDAGFAQNPQQQWMQQFGLGYKGSLYG